MPNGAGHSKRWNRGGLAVAALAAAAALAAPAVAGGATTGLPAEAEGVAQVVTAARVADWGRRTQDAPALILAARMMMQTPLRSIDIEGWTQGGDPAATPPSSGRADLTPAALLDEAENLARGDPRTLEEIAEARAVAARGVLDSPFGLGPIVASKDVQPQQTYGFRVSARRGEVLRVAAIGDGDADIDLTIHDPSGRQICRDGRFDHFPVCTVTPDTDGQLRIDIVNRGRVWTKVQIVSN